MAYMKYKELTKYFNFSEELDLNNLPEYVTDFVTNGEKVLVGYATSKDKFIMTTKKIVLFEVSGLESMKKIHFLPFNHISSSAIEFKPSKAAILLSMDSGYQLRLNFVDMTPDDKRKFRKVYMFLVDHITHK